MEVAVERKLYFCIHFLLLVGNSFDCFCMSLKNFCHLILPFTYLLVCGCCRLWVFSSLLVPPPPLSARHTHKKHTWQGRGIICAMYADWFSSRPTFVSSAVIPQDKEAYLDVIHRYLEIHGTVDNTAPIPCEKPWHCQRQRGTGPAETEQGECVSDRPFHIRWVHLASVFCLFWHYSVCLKPSAVCVKILQLLQIMKPVFVENITLCHKLGFYVWWKPQNKYKTKNLKKLLGPTLDWKMSCFLFFCPRLFLTKGRRSNLSWFKIYRSQLCMFLYMHLRLCECDKHFKVLWGSVCRLEKRYRIAS